MAILYVARSPTLATWGSDVGLTKHIYKVGIVNGSPASAREALNATTVAGVNDWRVLATRETEDVDEATALDRLARKEREIDAAGYPKIKGARGIFKVKEQNVENHFIVKRAYDDSTRKVSKPKPNDFAAYLVANALD